MGKDLLQWCGFLDWWCTFPDCPEDCPAEQSRPMEVCTSKGNLEADAYNDADKGGRPEFGIKQFTGIRIDLPHRMRNYSIGSGSIQSGSTRTAYESHTEISNQVDARIREFNISSHVYSVRVIELEMLDQCSNRWVQCFQSPTDSSR